VPDFNPKSLPESEMLPGGYDFIHVVFWIVAALVAVGTNLMPILLSAGLGVLFLEKLKKE
jgi:hypothetical protein